MEVVTATGVRSSHTTDIQTTFQEHWGHVMGDSAYGSGDAVEPTEAELTAYLSPLNHLSDHERADLDLTVTPDELADAIRHSTPHCAPGPDGFTAAFFQVDALLFGEILAKVFHARLALGSLDRVQRTAAVALLHKKGDRADQGNYRPIALIPVETKILSKALGYRLSGVLHQLIDPCQTGFVPGRHIEDHILTVRDLQH